MLEVDIIASHDVGLGLDWMIDNSRRSDNIGRDLTKAVLSIAVK